MTGKTKSKAQAIREEAQRVVLMATTGHLPLRSEDVEWINPTTSIPVPEIALNFGDAGVVELDPARPADKRILDVALPWLEAGEDPRIEAHAVRLVKSATMKIPYPNWVKHTPAKCAQVVEEMGLDVEDCLRYELQMDEPRKELVTKLEAMLDTPLVEDPTQVPEID